MKKFVSFLRKQNKAAELNYAQNEVLINEADHQCEKSVREAVSGTIIDKITRDHDKKLRQQGDLLDDKLEGLRDR